MQETPLHLREWPGPFHVRPHSCLEKGEALATTELAARDPVLKRLREIDDQEAAKRAAEAAKLVARPTIPQALLDWDNETHQAHTPGSASVLRTFIRKVERWAVAEGFRYLDEITRSSLGQWKAQWSEAAPRKDDRMGTQTQASFQDRLQEFFGWAYDTEKIDRDPSASLRTIKVKSTETLSLTPEQFEKLLAGLPKFDAATSGSRHFGRQLRSLFIMMHWTGLRTGDVLMLARSALRGDRLSLITYKTKARFDERIPDQVIAALAELQPRKHTHPDYFFWSGKAKYKSLGGLWEARILTVNCRN